MTTIRINFEKTGLAIYFSHLDLQRTMARALKKSGLPVWYSMGYNPHIYMTFTLPLSLGQESVCESFDFRLNEDKSEEEILSALKGTLPEGINLLSAGEPTYDAKQIKWALYDITLFGRPSVLRDCVESFKNAESVMTEKKTKKGIAQINLKELVKDIKVLNETENSLSFSAVFPAGVQYNVNPSLLLEYFSKNSSVNILTANIRREKLYDENMFILQ